MDPVGSCSIFRRFNFFLPSRPKSAVLGATKSSRILALNVATGISGRPANLPSLVEALSQ
jgi:hypothetical protein